MNIAIKEMQINEEIRDKELRVIMGDGEVLGIMSADEALSPAFTGSGRQDTRNSQEVEFHGEFQKQTPEFLGRG